MNRLPFSPSAWRRPLAALWLSLACSLAAAQTPPPENSLRPEVVRPLQAAQEALREKGPDAAKRALASIAEAAAVGGLSPFEQYTVQRMRAVAAVGAGDLAQAIADFDAVLAAPQLPAADRRPMLETSARLLVQTKQYARAIERLQQARAEGSSDAALRRLLPLLMAEVGDHAGAVREVSAQLQADEAAQQATPENLLRVLAASQNQLGDAAGYLKTLERLALATGKPDYWQELIARAARREGFAAERLALDVYRLRRAAGAALGGDELADMAQRAQQAGLPAEAQRLLDEGQVDGTLAKAGDAAGVQKLRQQVAQSLAQDRKTLADSEKSAQQAKEGTALVNLGFALSAAGEHERALALMGQGLAKGGLRRPDEARLHLAIAQWRAGRGDEALRSFADVQGGDGSAELARLWSLWLRGAAARGK